MTSIASAVRDFIHHNVIKRDKWRGHIAILTVPVIAVVIAQPVTEAESVIVFITSVAAWHGHQRRCWQC